MSVNSFTIMSLVSNHFTIRSINTLLICLRQFIDIPQVHGHQILQGLVLLHYIFTNIQVFDVTTSKKPENPKTQKGTECENHEHWKKPRQCFSPFSLSTFCCWFFKENSFKCESTKSLFTHIISFFNTRIFGCCKKETLPYHQSKLRSLGTTHWIIDDLILDSNQFGQGIESGFKSDNKIRIHYSPNLIKQQFLSIFD